MIPEIQGADHMHIDAALMIFGLGLNLRGFGTHKPARHTDTVTANIQQSTAPHFRSQTDVWRIAPFRVGHPETKGGSDQPR